MTLYLKNGTSYRVTSEQALNICNPLPNGNYIVQQDLMGLFLEEVDSFSLPKKIYGDVQKTTNRVFNTFADRNGTTGILLSGEKGSGKTLLAKNISIEGDKRNIPTIVINKPFHGDNFNKFLQDIDQPCIVLFDEFEKIYDPQQQEAILTLLDGVFTSKKLFIFTCNNYHKIDINMKNRPGRIFYFIEYDGLTGDFIREYCNDNLNDKSHTDYIVKLPAVFTKFNFDMLTALVEEMNRYEEDPQESLKVLNIKPDWTSVNTYDVELYSDNVLIEGAQKEWRGSPISSDIDFYIDKEDKDKLGEDEETYVVYNFKPTNIKQITNDGIYSYVEGNNRLLLKKKKYEQFDYSKVMAY